MKRHVGHLVMCAPMLVVAVLLLATGSPALSLLPLLGCVIGMWLMMRVMPGLHRHGHVSTEPSGGDGTTS